MGTIHDNEKLSKLIALSDIGLVPYDDNPLWRNSLPAKFFEYCACGVPIIATISKNSVLSNIITKRKVSNFEIVIHQSINRRIGQVCNHAKGECVLWRICLLPLAITENFEIK